MEFQSTLPARGATGSNDMWRNAVHDISIHAPRTGSDRAYRAAQFVAQISIHAPRTGSDHVSGAQIVNNRQFQSTLPARGATSVRRIRDSVAWAFQSTLPARGATVLTLGEKRTETISIHAPRTGSDGGFSPSRVFPCRFQSTLPARGATARITWRRRTDCISIHAPRTGSDTARKS